MGSRCVIRDWSLITGRGGLQNGRGGHVKFYPYEKGWWKKFWKKGGGREKFPIFKRGGGGTKSFSLS